MPKSLLASTALVIALALPNSASAAEAAPSYDTYKSWFIACDNGLACHARGFADDGNAESPDLNVVRDAGPDAKALVTLNLQFAAEAADLKVDGAPLSLAPTAWKVQREDGSTTLSLTGEEQVGSLIAQLRNASALQTSNPEASVPLDGFVAALLRMDERQGRIGGVTALVRKGKAAASAVVPAPDLPAAPRYKPGTPLKAGEDAALLARARKDLAAVFASQDCDPDISKDIDSSAAFALDDIHGLAFIACLMGAYQGSSLVALVPRDENQPAHLIRPTLPISESDTDTTTLTEPTFDPTTGTLAMSGRGRGLADCGMSAEWIWDGKQFQLTGGTYQMSCGGSQPGDWLTVYRSR